MKDSKKNVIKTLEFDSPDQIPIQLWDLPWAEIHYSNELKNIRNTFPDDIVSVPDIISKPIRTKGSEYKIGKYIDEWGCIFENRQDGIIGEVKNPIIKSWDDIDTLHVPNEFLSLEIE